MENQNKKKEIIRAIKFTLISISAGIIQIGVFTLLNEVFSLDYWAAHIPSLVLSVLWNFTINRKYTFKSASNVPKAMLLVFLFYLVFTPTSAFLGDLAEKAGWNDYIIEALVLIANFLLEFIYTRFIVYRNSCDTAVSKKEENVDEPAKED